MMIGSLHKGALLIAVGLLAPCMSHALEVDIYGGLATGYAVQKQATGDDTTDDAEKVYVGSRFLGPIGIEIAYHNLGKYNNASEDVRVTSAVVMANLDIRGMTLFAKGGAMKWKQTDLTTGTKRHGEEFIYGAGINLAVDRHILFRTELEFFHRVGEDDTANDPGKDMYMLSFGVNFVY